MCQIIIISKCIRVCSYLCLSLFSFVWLYILTSKTAITVCKIRIRRFPRAGRALHCLQSANRLFSTNEASLAAHTLYKKFRAIFCSDEEEEDNPEVRNEDVACETNE